MGENVAQAAHYVQSGNADIGIIALALALNKELAAMGNHALIDDRLHAPLEQGFIVTRRAAGNPLAAQFAGFISSAAGRKLMAAYGFVLPGEGK
jgi:molybdate transport system substrate-binding protein